MEDQRVAVERDQPSPARRGEHVSPSKAEAPIPSLPRGTGRARCPRSGTRSPRCKSAASLAKRSLHRRSYPAAVERRPGDGEDDRLGSSARALRKSRVLKRQPAPSMRAAGRCELPGSSQGPRFDVPTPFRRDADACPLINQILRTEAMADSPKGLACSSSSPNIRIRRPRACHVRLRRRRDGRLLALR